MRKKTFIVLILLTFLLEAVVSVLFLQKSMVNDQDVVAINHCVKTVEENFGNEEKYSADIEYALISPSGEVLFQTSDKPETSVNEAIKKNDTILQVYQDEKLVGTLIFHNDTMERINAWRRGLVITVLICVVAQAILLILYHRSIQKSIVKPFSELSSFAERVAGGNLDLPLPMDRKHVFGSFTEAFDLMREEIKKSRKAEKEANDAKKEMVAKLSHDIKTPVASIKSASEFGYELAKEEKVKERFNLINYKADELTVLVDNLFQSSVHDATEIQVSPRENDSESVREAILHADYLQRAEDFSIPSCQVFTDKLRLQQAFDNVFINSYKYADTAITVKAWLENGYLKVAVRDFGPGVTDEEVAVLKEKYKRGKNSEGKEGAGIGLYLTSYFLKEMDGDILITNEDPGLQVLFLIRTV